MCWCESTNWRMGGDKTLYNSTLYTVRGEQHRHQIATPSTTQLPLRSALGVYTKSPSLPCPGPLCAAMARTAHLGSRVTAAVDSFVITIANAVLWKGKGTIEPAWRGCVSQTSHRKSSFQIGAPSLLSWAGLVQG